MRGSIVNWYNIMIILYMMKLRGRHIHGSKREVVRSISRDARSSAIPNFPHEIYPNANYEYIYFGVVSGSSHPLSGLGMRSIAIAHAYRPFRAPSERGRRSSVTHNYLYILPSFYSAHA